MYEIRSVEVREINHVRYRAVEVTDPENTVAGSGSRVVGMSRPGPNKKSN